MNRRRIQKRDEPGRTLGSPAAKELKDRKKEVFPESEHMEESDQHSLARWTLRRVEDFSMEAE